MLVHLSLAQRFCQQINFYDAGRALQIVCLILRSFLSKVVLHIGVFRSLLHERTLHILIEHWLSSLMIVGPSFTSPISSRSDRRYRAS